MKSGVQLDVLIAARCEGLTVFEDPVNYRGYAVCHSDGTKGDVPRYSELIADAWGLVERLHNRGYSVWVGTQWIIGRPAYCAQVKPATQNYSHCGESDDVAHAICLAVADAFGLLP